jgi:MoxR-like ATPase
VAKRHADFVCIAAANTYGHGADRVYAGRNQLDGATLDRFRTGIVAMDYSEALEEQLVNESVLSWGRALRQRIGSAKLRRILSTRALISFSQQVAAYGWGRDAWEESYFADWSRDELAKVGR